MEDSSKELTLCSVRFSAISQQSDMYLIYSVAGLTDINDFVSQVPAPIRRTPTPIMPVRIERRRNVSNLLELLDSRVRPGVTEIEFCSLFVKCDCGYILTKRAFNDHACSREVVDLTDDIIDLTAV